jgi:hypothetical protein
MDITKVRKGERPSLPLHFIGKGQGWSNAEAPEDGLKIGLNDSEWMPGGIYITDTQLREAGYTRAKTMKVSAERLAKNFLKGELEWFAEKLGLATTGTKFEIARRISENL